MHLTQAIVFCLGLFFFSGEAALSKKTFYTTPFTCPPIHQINIIIDANNFTEMNNGGNNGMEYACQIVLNGVTYHDAYMEVHGASSSGYAKKSYDLMFSNYEWPYGGLFNYSYANSSDDSVKDITLNAGWVDKTFMRQKLTADLLSTIGAFASRIVWAEVSINGKYHGFYQFMEKVKDDFLDARDRSSDGNFYKAVSHDANWSWKGGSFTNGYDTSKAVAPYDDLKTLYQLLDNTTTTFAEWEAKVAPWFDIEQWISYSFVHAYAVNYDGFDKNYYLYHDPAKKNPFLIITWDSDATWGNNWDGNPRAPLDKLFGAFNADGTDYLSPKLFGIPEYYQSYLLNFQKLVADDGLFTPSLINSWIDAHAACIKNAVNRDFAVSWSGRSTDNNTFTDAITFMKQSVTNRANRLKDTLIPAALQAQANPQDVLYDKFGLQYFENGFIRTKTLISPQNTVLINEIGNVQTGDWVEFYNPNSASVDLSNFLASDDTNNPSKKTMPVGYSVPANSYRVINATDLGFSFSSNGEEFVLYTPTGYKVGHVEFDAVPTNKSIGRYRTSDGKDHYVLMPELTQGGPNGYPEIPKVVFSEINFRPPQGDYESLTLVSKSSSDINLFDGTTGWKISGVQSFVFPVGTVLPAGGTVLVVGVDPNTYRTKYNIPSSIQIFGPFLGTLHNYKDKIALMSVVPGSNNYALVEEINYSYTSPWPNQLTNQGSIKRRSLVSFGNDPANWVSATASLTCNGDSSCPMVDDCTVATCGQSVCNYSLVTCQQNNAKYRSCFPWDKTCVPPSTPTPVPTSNPTPTPVPTTPTTPTPTANPTPVPTPVPTTPTPTSSPTTPSPTTPSPTTTPTPTPTTPTPTDTPTDNSPNAGSMVVPSLMIIVVLFMLQL